MHSQRGQPYLVPGSRLPKRAVSAPTFARRPTAETRNREIETAGAGCRWPAVVPACIAICSHLVRSGRCDVPCDDALRLLQPSVVRLRRSRIGAPPARQPAAAALHMRTESRHAYSRAVGQQSREREQRGGAREDQRAACRCGSRACNMLGSLLVVMMADERRPNLTARSSI